MSISKGPWITVNKGSQHSTLISANPDGGSENGGIYIAEAKGPNHAANAQAIALLPELIEALRDLLIDAGTLKGHAFEDMETVHYRARSLLARLEGGDE